MRKTMQNRRRPGVKSICFLFISSLLFSGNNFAQSKEEMENRKFAVSDSLFNASLKACLHPVESQKPETWLNRFRVLSNIMDDPNLVASHAQNDLPTETANALLMLKALDGNQIYRHFTEPGLAGICIDLGNSGIHSLENARLYDSEEDAKKAASLLEKAMECYKLTGDSRVVVDKEWGKHALDPDWFRFFIGVAYRKAGDKTRAAQEYNYLLEKEWPQSFLYLEAANLSDSVGLVPEAIEILEKGFKRIPGSIEIGCALVQINLKADKVKEARAWLRKVEAFPQSRFHPDYAYAQGAYFEKRGDFKTADACYQIPYQADPNEVSGIRKYAAFLIRNAGKTEGQSPEQQAARAYKMLLHAKELSPENAKIDQELERILSRYPGAGKS